MSDLNLVDVISSDDFDAILNENTQVGGSGRAPVYCKAEFRLGYTWFSTGFNGGSDDIFLPFIPGGKTDEEKAEKKKIAVEAAYDVAKAQGIPLVNPGNGKKVTPTYCVRVKLYNDCAYKEMGEGIYIPITTWKSNQVHCYPDWKGTDKGKPYRLVLESLKRYFTGKNVFTSGPVYVKIEFVPDPSASPTEKKFIETVTEVYESFEDMVEKVGIDLSALGSPDSQLPGYTDAIKELNYDAGTWRDMSVQFRAQSAAGKSAEQIASEYELPLDAVQAVLA